LLKEDNYMNLSLIRLLMTASIFTVLAGCSAHNQSASIDDSSAKTAITNPASSVNIAVQYEVPAGWLKSDAQDITTFTAPEKDASVAVVRIRNVGNAAQAAAAAWKMHDPGFNRDIRLNAAAVASKGWDRVREIEYVTSIAEEMIVYAYVHQVNDQWQVVLIDGQTSTLVKRQAATWGLVRSFAVEGYKPQELRGRVAHQMTAERIEAIQSFVEKSAKALKVPGVGFAIIQDGEVVFSGGVGYESADGNELVTENTLFMIASNTKGMTTLLLAKLVEMGKLTWNDRVIDHYPDFKLGDLKTTESVLIKHLVCACTGLPRKDMDWVFNSGPVASALATFSDLANTAPTSEFGELFQYNNQMASAAGYVAAHLLYPEMEIGAGYDKAMQEYIFDPLAMTDTTLSFARALDGKFASPHSLDLDGNVQLIPQTKTTGFNHTLMPYRPAGGAWSSAADMIKYVQNELSQGVGPDGQRLFAAQPLLERRKSFVSTGADSSYGMGLSNKNIDGIDIVQHGGSMAGYKSNIIAIPEANVGAVILTNSDEGSSLLRTFTQRLIEVLYDAEETAVKQIAVAVESNQLNASKQREEFTYPADPEVLSNLASRYESTELGPLEIRQHNGEATFDPGVWSSPLGSKQNADGTTSMVMTAPFLLGFEILVGKVNGKRTLSLIDTQHTYVFTEVE
jgi:CubicO group peptidase (beta-lactamase class C family)